MPQFEEKNLDEVDALVNKASQKREDDVTAAVNQAPAVIHSNAHWVQNAGEKFFGGRSMKQILGVGEESIEGRDAPGVYKSVNTADRKGNSHVPVEVMRELFQLKRMAHDLQILAWAQGRKTMIPARIEDLPYYQRYVAPKAKAFNLTDFSNWVPTVNARFYFEEYEIDPGLESYFEHVPMQSKTEQVPGALNRLMGKLQSDSDFFTEQANTQSAYTYTAQDCVTHTKITEDLLQDATPDIFERHRKEVMYGVQRAKEYALINGDDTDSGTGQGSGHQDTDVASVALNFGKAFKGLRKLALANSANGSVVNQAGAPVDLPCISKLVGAMGKFAKDKADLVWIMGPSVSNKIVTGGIPEILTIQNFGAQATLVTGGLAPIFGIKPYESEWVREDLAATGIFAAASALTTLLLVKRSRFVLGQRSPVKIWATPSLANADTLLMTGKERFTFGGVPQSSTEKSVVIARNIALA